MKINNPLIRKMGATLLAILLLIYVGYQIYLINYQGIKTETATYAEVSDTIQLSAWVVRDETVIHANYSGVPYFRVNDGDKVSKNGMIADIYATEEDATAQTQMLRLEEEISSLESLKEAEEYYVASPELIGTQIDETIVSILDNTTDNNYSGAVSYKPRLQYLLNQKRIIVGKESATDYQSRINALKEEKNQLYGSSSGRIDYITAPESGYFVSTVDGYEDSFDYESIEEITVSDLKNIKQGNVGTSVCGKIEKDFSWYVVAEVDEAQKIKLEKYDTVSIELPFATTEQIPADVVALNKDEETGTYALVLRCDYMNADLSGIRNETVEVIINTYSGVLVNEKSIYFEDVTRTETDENGNTKEVTYEDVKGVYVKYGEKINFVQIFSDITINGYAICKTQLSEEEEKLLHTDNTIGLYDEVVTGGTDLYDGKLL